MAKHYKIRPEVENLLRDPQYGYNGTNERTAELSAQTGFSVCYIQHLAKQLGLTKPCRHWTDEEEAKLEKWLPNKSLAWIAERLGRSEIGVLGKQHRKHLHKLGEDLTAQDIAVGFGCEWRIVESWIKSGKLKAEKRNIKRKRDIYFITYDSLQEFAKQNQDIIEKLKSKMDRFQLLWLDEIIKGGKHGLGSLDKDED